MEEKKEMKYEEAIARLEQIVRILEEGGRSLDESVKLFEEGAALSGFCAEALKNARLKITQLKMGDTENG